MQIIILFRMKIWDTTCQIPDPIQQIHQFNDKYTKFANQSTKYANKKPLMCQPKQSQSKEYAKQKNKCGISIMRFFDKNMWSRSDHQEMGREWGNVERMRKLQTLFTAFVAKIMIQAFWGNNSGSKQIARKPYNWCKPANQGRSCSHISWGVGASTN